MEGTHEAKCDGFQWGHTKNGNTQIVCSMKIEEGDHKGKSIAWFGYFTEATWERTMQSLRYMGWKGSNLDELGALNDPVQIVVEAAEWEGKTRMKVAWVNRLGSGTVRIKHPMDEKQIRMFAAKMKDKAASVDEVETAPADNIPF